MYIRFDYVAVRVINLKFSNRIFLAQACIICFQKVMWELLINTTESHWLHWKPWFYINILRKYYHTEFSKKKSTIIANISAEYTWFYDPVVLHRVLANTIVQHDMKIYAIDINCNILGVGFLNYPIKKAKGNTCLKNNCSIDLNR